MGVQPSGSFFDGPTSFEPNMLLPKRPDRAPAPLQADVLNAINKHKEELLEIGRQSAANGGGACCLLYLLSIYLAIYLENYYSGLS